MSTRYLYKDGERPRYVHIWTPFLAERPDMIECDANGKKISSVVKQPVEEKQVELPLLGVVDAPPFVPPAVGQLPDIPAAPSADERVLEIQARLSAMKSTEIRQAIKNDFNGAKAPAGISKLQLVEAYLQFDSASRA